MTERRRKKIEELFKTHGEGVGGFVLARVGDPELAEEITSRVFLTVVRKIGQCRRSPAGWLWSIVRTELARHFRDRRDHPPCDQSLPDPHDGPADQAQRVETGIRMSAALSRLGRSEQEMIYMKFFQGMRNVDIAEATGLTPANVAVTVHRSLKRLRAMMDGSPAAAAGGRTRQTPTYEAQT